MTWIYIRRFAMDTAFFALGAGWQYSIARYRRAKTLLNDGPADG